jgi:hypothetical protein
MKKQILNIVLACAGAIVFAGCVNMSNDYGSVVTQGQKDAIVKGKTTKTEVLQQLGNPDQKIDLGNNKEQFSYIKENVGTKTSLIIPTGSVTSRYTEYWIVFENDIVTDTGERPTTKQPNYFK